MRFIRSIAMTTDYTYHGAPCEVTRIDLYLAEEMLEDPEAVRRAGIEQVNRLLHSRKKVLIRDQGRVPTWPDAHLSQPSRAGTHKGE